MNKLLVNSGIRLLMGGLAFYLAQRGFDQATIDTINQAILSLLGASGVAGLALAWSANEKRVSRETLPEQGHPIAATIPQPENPVNVEEYPIDKGYSFSDRSLANMNGLHPDLLEVLEHAIVNAPYDFTVIEGLRTLTRQKALFDAKKSLTMNSKHLVQKDGFGHAFDLGYIFNNRLDERYTTYEMLNDHLQEVANSLGVKLKWGGTFKRANGKPFVDAGHWELIG